MTIPHPRVPHPPHPTDARRAVFAFDQAVDRIGEEAAFLALGPNRQAARYVADAHRALDEVRVTMHRIEMQAGDAMLRRSAQKRLHLLAATVAEAGLRDADHVAKVGQWLGTRTQPGVAPALRIQAVKAAAWGVEKWTGSPLAPMELRSTAAAVQAATAVEPIVRRGRVRRRPLPRTWRRTGVVTAALGGGSLAAYGAWSLVAPLLGLG